MKKNLFSILLAALCVASMAVATNAGATNNEERNIPMAATAPTIDGKITGDEWDNALTIAMNKDTMDAISVRWKTMLRVVPSTGCGTMKVCTSLPMLPTPPLPTPSMLLALAPTTLVTVSSSAFIRT